MLWSRGTAFVGPQRTRNGFLTGVIKNPDHATAEDDRLARRSVGRMQIEMAQMEGQSVRHLVISEENLIGSMGQNLSSCQLYDQAEARLRRLAPAFGDRPITIGLGVRSYASLWSSQIAFRIKSGSTLPREGKLDRLATQPRRWRDIIGDVASVFPAARIVVWTFEAWADRPAQLTAALTGMPQPTDAKPCNDWANASPPVEELRALLHDGGNKSAAQKLDGQLGRFAPFPAMHRQKLQDDYRSDLDWLEAGADGLATYLTPTGGTLGGYDMTRGRCDDVEERHVAGAG